MDQRQYAPLRGAVRDPGTLPTDAEQTEPGGSPSADQIPTGTVGAAPDEPAAPPPAVPGDTPTTTGTSIDTRRVEPGAGAARADVECGT